MYDDLLYKLWLNIQCRNVPERIYKCLDGGVTAEEIFKSDTLYKRISANSSLSARLGITRSLSKAYELAEECEKSGISIISIDDKEYPKRLAEVYMPPQILYVKGELPPLDDLVAINIVGSRRCSRYSEEFSQKLAYDLGSAGILTVSGMAKGIDGFAHSGALMAGNKTVAVLAGGVDVIYPKQNADLYYEIIQNGAVISEMPPGQVGKGSFYRNRNRIMVGLCCGTVIIEGEESSGTSISANWTAESNRDLFAVPGKPGDKGSALPNKLIKENAKLITSAEDIIEEYIGTYSSQIDNGLKLCRSISSSEYTAYKNMPSPSGFGDTYNTYEENKKTSSKKVKKSFASVKKTEPPRKKPSFEEFDDKQRIILEFLYNNNDAVHIDDISTACGVEPSELNFLILQLMMAGAVKEHAGDNYSISL